MSQHTLSTQDNAPLEAGITFHGWSGAGVRAQTWVLGLRNGLM